VTSAGVIFILAAGEGALVAAVGLTAVVGVAAGLAVFGEAVDIVVRELAWGAMENASRTLLATPEGLLHLFLEACVSVEALAGAFQTETQVVEASIREAMRKRDAINRAAAPSPDVRLHTIGDAA
jgi:hypothetical protein